jgi:hypothetical protein
MQGILPVRTESLHLGGTGHFTSERKVVSMEERTWSKIHCITWDELRALRFVLITLILFSLT